MRRTFLPLGLLLVACGSSERTLVLPELNEAQSFIALFVGGSASSEALGVAGTVDSAVHLELPFEEERRLLLLYETPLTELGIEPGPLLPFRTRTCALLEPAALYTSVGTDGKWTSTTELSTTDQERLVGDPGRCNPCLTFDEVRVPIPPDPRDVEDTPSSAVWLESGDVFFFTHRGRAFAANRTDGVRPITGCTKTYFALHGSGPNLFWASGWHGAVDLIRIDEATDTCSVERETIVPRQGGFVGQRHERFNWLTGPPDGQVPLYTLSSTGSAFEFDGNAWTHLVDLDLNADETEEVAEGKYGAADGGLLWLGESSLALAVGGNDIVLWQNGSTRFQSLDGPAGGPEEVTSLTQLPGFGVLAGSRLGRIYLRNGDQWRAVGSRPTLGSTVRVIAPIANRGFLAPMRGPVFQYYRETDFCPEQHEVTNAGARPRLVLADTDGSFLIPDFITDQLLWLVPQPK